MNVEFWKKYICHRIREVSRHAWENIFNNTEREKECPGNESFADGNVGGGLRLMVRMFASERE